MRRFSARPCLVLLSCWLAVTATGEPAAVYQWAAQLSGVELDPPGDCAPDDDEDADELIVATVAARRPGRRLLHRRVGMRVRLDAVFAKPFTAPARPRPALPSAAPDFHRGAGAFLRC